MAPDEGRVPEGVLLVGLLPMWWGCGQSECSPVMTFEIAHMAACLMIIRDADGAVPVACGV